MIPSTKAKRHHYLPQFYLNGFCRDGLLFIYDISTKSIRKQTPMNTAVIGNYYTDIIDGQEDKGIEIVLQENESNAKHVIDKLRTGEEITPEDRVHLALFLGFMACRTPDFENALNEITQKTSELLLKRSYQLNQAHWSEHFNNQEEAFKAIESMLYRPAKVHLSFLRLDKGIKCGEQFNLMNWCIFHCEEPNSFVTSDNPFGFIFENEEQAKRSFGLFTQDILKVVPMAHDCCLLMMGQECNIMHFKIQAEQVDQINKSIAEEAFQYIISRDEYNIPKISDNILHKRPTEKTKFEIHEVFDHKRMKSIMIAMRVKQK